MAQIPKVAGVLSCAVVLGFGLSTVTLATENSLAADEIKAEQNAERKDSLPGLFKQDPDVRKGIHTDAGRSVTRRG